jgi:hypothetical protein
MAFSPQANRKIKEGIRRVRAAPYFPAREGSANPPLWNPGVLAAVVTTAIPTGTTSAPSTTGQATVHRWDDPTQTDSAELNPAFVNVPVYNRKALSASIAVGKNCDIYWADGVYWLLQAEC